MDNLDEQICKCFGLFNNELTSIIETYKYTSASELSEDLGYGTKCGKCLDQIENIIKGVR